MAGPLPDLSYATRQTLDAFESILLSGSLPTEGMPSFSKILSAKEV